MATTHADWPTIRTAAPHLKRVLLYGPPGTGKSYMARTAGLKDGTRVHPIVVHSDLPAAELRGHFVPQKDGGLHWMDGPAVAAWRDGGRLVLDEIDKAGDDSLSFLLGVLDDVETAELELGTTGEILKPHPDFTVWATMNGEPDDLPPALIDRFVVMVPITEPNPEAIKRLAIDLQHAAKTLSVATDPSRRIGIRSFMEYDRLRKVVKPEVAAALVFGPKWAEVHKAISFGGKADPR